MLPDQHEFPPAYRPSGQGAPFQSPFPPQLLQYQAAPAPKPITAWNNGSLRLFQFYGITVFLHWSWFLAAVWMIQSRQRMYTSLAWNIAEYLCLFGIVLTHEFGHALACRSVGGKANRIMLWPLGGIAYVDPPPRAGAMLWSIAAGPLVNVVLVPITYVLSHSDFGLGANFVEFSEMIFRINLGLLIFNMLPIYPLDGGQILQSLLWFAIGRGWSLMIASWIGVAGAVGGAFLAFYYLGDWWIVFIAVWAASMAWRGTRFASALLAMEKQQPVHSNFTYMP